MTEQSGGEVRRYVDGIEVKAGEYVIPADNVRRHLAWLINLNRSEEES